MILKVTISELEGEEIATAYLITGFPKTRKLLANEALDRLEAENEDAEWVCIENLVEAEQTERDERRRYNALAHGE